MNYKKINGFTLMELLIVVTIVGILAAIMLPRFLTTTSLNKKYATRAEIQIINAQMELYYYPISLDLTIVEHQNQNHLYTLFYEF